MTGIWFLREIQDSAVFYNYHEMHSACMGGEEKKNKKTPQNESCVTFRNRHMSRKEETQLKHKPRVAFHRAEITLEEKERG